MKMADDMKIKHSVDGVIASIEEQDKLKKHQSKKIKNLQKEVELILSQDDSEDEQPEKITTRHSKRLTHQQKVADQFKVEELQPISEESSKKQQKQNNQVAEPKTPSTNNKKLMETPRRSARKSTKPALDYEDIVEKRLMRSTIQGKYNDDVKNSESDNDKQHRWSSAEVGKGYGKRKKQKGKKLKINGEESEKNAEKKDSSHNIVKPMVEIEHIPDNEMPPLILEEDGEENIMMNTNVQEEIIILEDNPNSIKKEKDAQATNIEPLVQPEMFHVVQEKTGEQESSSSSILFEKDQFKNIQDCAAQKMEKDFCVNKEEANQELIQESKLLESSEQTSVVNSNNLIRSNTFITTETLETSNESKISTAIEDDIKNFGEYLKSNDLDISDLGLQPLDNGGTTNQKNDADDMPSLILCDDLEDNDNEMNTNKDVLNTTFDKTDCIEVDSPKQQEDINTIEIISDDENNMQTLQLSDDESSKEEKSVKSRVKFQLPIKIKLTNADDKDLTLLTCNVPMPSTPKTRQTKEYRFPTPFRNKKDFEFTMQRDGTPKKTVSQDNTFKQQVEHINTISLRDLVLQKRKRSNSVSPSSKAVSLCRVKFFSPANQIVTTDDLDKVMKAKSSKNFVPQNKLQDSFVTKRKRSISLDELYNKRSKIPEPTIVPLVKPSTLNKTRQPNAAQIQPRTRTKIPNFAAIHQKQFNQMENLVEHIERKAERAKILSNSATKLRLNSAQKSATKQAQKNFEKPKAVKKIDLQALSGGVQHPGAKENRSAATTKLNLEYEDVLRKKNLPNPQSFLDTTVRKPLTATNITTSKPKFNLSTQVSSSKKASAVLGKTPVVRSEDKTMERRQRHMEMFKSRSAAKETSRSNIIRGVRSNRRFELQMEHRKNIERENSVNNH